MLAILAMLHAMAGTGGPVTRVFTSGTNFNDVAPAGVTTVTITVDGPGGAGAMDIIGSTPGGGAGGARCSRTIAVTPGQTLTCTVAPAVPGRNTNGYGQTGVASTVAGTVSGGVVNMSAGPGTGGGPSVPGVGGNATGGTSNIAGSAGSIPDGGAGASGAAGGTFGTPAGAAPGGGGLGKDGGTSGPGARGQITLDYF